MSRERLSETSYRRRCNKWAMCGLKGGLCVACGRRVTSSNMEQFHFDHKEQVNSADDKTDRWGGGIRNLPPFTERWFAWAKTVELICEGCHHKRHAPMRVQMALDLAVQERLNGYANHDDAAAPQSQLALFSAGSSS